MSNSHDEIKNLLKASRNLLTNNTVNEDYNRIKTQYGIINEQVGTRFNVGKSIEDEIENDTDSEYETADSPKGDKSEKSSEDKKQAYRISGGILVLHGKDNSELELTTDEKTAFQETMDEFVAEVSDMVDFNKLNVYEKNVEWSGKIIDFDVEFYYSIGEENGVYIEGDMIKTDEKFLEFVNKLKTYYDKFKSKWAKILASRKKTSIKKQ
jgi:hypothetical protein